jgi:type I restriction-modification system DNA methylase subunit
MVEKIFAVFLEIEDSSVEIEKIINVYLRFAYQRSESKEEIIYNNLAINTFNYMIETDETLKVPRPHPEPTPHLRQEGLPAEG